MDHVFAHKQGHVDGTITDDVWIPPTGSTPAPAPTIFFDAASQLGTWNLSAANLRAYNAGSSGVEAGIRLNTPIEAAGSTYFEAYIHNSGSTTGGVGLNGSGGAVVALWWYSVNGYMYYSLNGWVYHASTYSNYTPGQYDSGATIGILVKNGKLYPSYNGTFYGDYVAETNPAWSGLSGDYYPALYAYNSGVDIQLRLSAADMVYPIPAGASTLLP